MNMWSSAQMPPRQSQKSVESIAELSMFRGFSFKGGEKYSQASKQTNKQVAHPNYGSKAMDNFRERLQECVINNGRHLSDVTFKSI